MSTSLKNITLSLLLSCCFLPAPTSAATVDFNPQNPPQHTINMQTVVPGNSGIINSSTTFSGVYLNPDDRGPTYFPVYDKVSGILPTQTQITFSYSITTDTPNYYEYFDLVGSFGAENFDVHYPVDPAHNQFSIFADRTIEGSATVNGNNEILTIRLANMSGADIGFSARVTGGPHMAATTVDTRYESAALAPPVPLPAALPLFGAGIAGLAAMRRRKQTK